MPIFPKEIGKTHETLHIQNQCYLKIELRKEPFFCCKLQTTPLNQFKFILKTKLYQKYSSQIQYFLQPFSRIFLFRLIVLHYVFNVVLIFSNITHWPIVSFQCLFYKNKVATLSTPNGARLGIANVDSCRILLSLRALWSTKGTTLY